MSGGVIGNITGFGSSWENVDAYGDVIKPGAFRASLAKSMPLMFWQHDPRHPIGVWYSARENERGLLLEGQLVDTQMGREAHTLLKAGAINGLSIGFRIPPGGASVNSSTGLRTIHSIDLVETSVVSVPANDQARVTEVRQDTDESARLRKALARFSDGPGSSHASLTDTKASGRIAEHKAIGPELTTGMRNRLDDPRIAAHFRKHAVETPDPARDPFKPLREIVERMSQTSGGRSL